MFKKFIAASITALVLSNSAAAQASPGDAKPDCSIGSIDITSVVVTKCSGFWKGNLLNTNAGQLVDADEAAGLAALGYGPLNVVEKIGANPSQGFVNFNTTLYGYTIIGLHFGGGAPLLKNADPALTNGTAFYLFNAGAAGVDVLTLSADLGQGSSGLTLYSTRGGCGTGEVGVCGTVVPEPSTYALMATGLLGIFGFARRRRNNA